VVRRDAIEAVATLALGAGAAVAASKLPFGGLRNPGPGFFPWWLGLVLLLLGAVLLGQALRNRASATGGAARPWKVVLLLAALAVYVLVLDAAGYAIATFLLVVFMLRGLEPHRWPLALTVAVVAAGGSYVLFAVWLGVPLPAGPLAR
jgi:putative tricarboxylic transport membrane protein